MSILRVGGFVEEFVGGRGEAVVGGGAVLFEDGAVFGGIEAEQLGDEGVGGGPIARRGLEEAVQGWQVFLGQFDGGDAPGAVLDLVVGGFAVEEVFDEEEIVLAVDLLAAAEQCRDEVGVAIGGVVAQQ